VNPIHLTTGDWVINCPICGNMLTREIKGKQIFKICQFDPNHYFLVDSYITNNQKGEKMYKAGNVFFALIFLSLVAPVIFTKLRPNWLFVPLIIAAAGLATVITIAIKSTRKNPPTQ